MSEVLYCLLLVAERISFETFKRMVGVLLSLETRLIVGQMMIKFSKR